MTQQDRDIYVVSDLHIGGAYAKQDAQAERGFRICTHVQQLAQFCLSLAELCAKGRNVEFVINGDFIDFLAEPEFESDVFVAFRESPERVVEILDRIVQRDIVLFAALRDLLAAGARLTVLLGNHDVELGFPAVRRRLAHWLDAIDDSARAGRFSFIYDGEAYVIGDALIEHGNRYDAWNAVDHDALRRLRSLQSRGQETSRAQFEPPAGSVLVSTIMNPIKSRYPFVDLLKPETSATLPILLALEPGVRGQLANVWALQRRASKHGPVAAAEPAWSGDISAMDNASESSTLDDDLRAVLGAEEAEEFLRGVENEFDSSGDISSVTLDSALGVLRLMTGSNSSALEKRLPALLAALQPLQNDRTFEDTYEPEGPYLDAARELAQNGIRYIIFGHTHLARKIDLGDGRTYFNSGTWADLIRFPPECLSGSKTQALMYLQAFLNDLVERRFERWISFRPTYVRLALREGHVVQAELCSYDAS